jgi:uncharacterized cupredoxin-like copper-binding protein
MFMGLWIVVVLIAVAAAAGWSTNQGSSPPRTSAREILDQRLANGELAAAEHAERGTALGIESSTTGRDTWKPWAIVGIGAAVLLLIATLAVGSGWGWAGTGWMGEHMGWGGTTATSIAPHADAREVAVEAGDLWFAPDQIEVAAGEEVNLRVTNTGDAFHDLTVPAAGVMLDVEAGDEVVGGIRLDEPGTYDFYCSVPGHADAGMTGTIIVTD